MNRKIAVIGLGYVGLPVAVAFGKKHPVIGFDINEHRISTLQTGVDYTNEVEVNDLTEAQIEFTFDSEKLKEADFMIVSVPTPIDAHNQPDLSPLMLASETVGKSLQKGAIVVFESTVYPGAYRGRVHTCIRKAFGLEVGHRFFRRLLSRTY